MEVLVTISIFQLKKTHFGVVMSHDDIIPGSKNNGFKSIAKVSLVPRSGTEECPLTQMSLKRGLDEAREEYRNPAAPPTPANAPILQDLSDAPMPFPKMRPNTHLGMWLLSSFAISAPVRSMCGGLCEGSTVYFV